MVERIAFSACLYWFVFLHDFLLEWQPKFRYSAEKETMCTHLSLFRPHLALAHRYWKDIVMLGDSVIDATCGNGHDTLLLSQLALKDAGGSVLAMDIQSKAISHTRSLLESRLPKEKFERILLLQRSHAKFPEDILPGSTKLIVYNLGYLPGGDKMITTKVETTRDSLIAATRLITPGGAISVMCYPGHPEGKMEESMLLDLVSSFDSKEWNCCLHRWVNRFQSPSLLLIQKALIS
jgi:Putative rRNA methylase